MHVVRQRIRLSRHTRGDLTCGGNSVDGPIVHDGRSHSIAELPGQMPSVFRYTYHNDGAIVVRPNKE